MGLEIANFARRYPYLFHITPRPNFPRIRRLRLLQPAAALFRSAGRADLASMHREQAVSLSLSDGIVTTPDQQPLRLANIDLEAGWTFPRWIEHLNRHVFFWPGRSEGPISAGRNYFARYESEGPLIMRVPAMDLFAGSILAPRFSRFNSGAPRYSRGVPSPRGGSTFRQPADFSLPPSRVVEVTFPGAVPMPKSAEFSASLGGPWRLIW